ncbi:Methyltransferase type 11 [[Leptolyngbya] sp. PCC 7376]|uniref:class I SAM-dependent methyltransferase n=1 Tax=[Leptolyngbya] sp. PCC 7376 TaxID=111781 RepID=UPI00029EFEFF|nr:class I SAM-dependent methyltransferase [[Leptolyngbya] sp. PCC 7376]AFY37396.1 Methyltransferase type 11 [[Leptolyngbya] sp. PCC 7376]
MPSKKELTEEIQSIFNTAADTFDHPTLSFWNRFGQNTVDNLALKEGDRVLDVCSGSGASAMPAAEKVGSTGKVISVDLANSLLDLARQKATQQGLDNIEFRCGDFTELGYPDNHFDAIICVFGIFFVDDMQAALRELLRMLRPGGKLVITSWGNNVFEPGNSLFKQTVRAVNQNFFAKPLPWESIKTPQSLEKLLLSADATQIEIISESIAHPLNKPEDWWTMMLGGGFRGVIEKLDPEIRQTIYRQNIDYLRDHNVTALDIDVMYAIARK